MITVKVLLGKDTVSIYRKTGDISSVESTAESGGYVITRHFETEAEYKAYAMAVEDLDGHEDCQMLTPAVTPEAPFRKGEFVRLTDDAIKRIRESFGDGPADYRKEMILEVIAWCRYEGASKYSALLHDWHKNKVYPYILSNQKTASKALQTKSCLPYP